MKYSLEMAQAFATETFWEYIRANISVKQAENDIFNCGLYITEDELKESRMRNSSAMAWFDNKRVELRQPC